MAGYIGSRASVVSSGAERKKTFAITGTTTSLSGLSYTPTFVHLFHNGVRLVDGTDYTATNGSDITLTSAAESGDEVVVISYASFQVADAYTKAEADAEFVSDPNGAVTVDGSGNVGIGTASPALPLSVDGDIWQGNTNGVEIGRITNNVGWYDFGASSNVNGAQMSHPAIVRFNTASTERMRIDASGRVTMPYQPAFEIGRASSQPFLPSTITIVEYDVAYSNVGNHYNISTHRFTAPVSGFYSFSAQALIYKSTNTRIDWIIRVNGANHASEENQGLTSAALNTSVSGSWNLYLASGDYVQIAAQLVNGGNPYIYPANVFNRFSGYLIG